jgi:hypothetical protein
MEASLAAKKIVETMRVRPAKKPAIPLTIIPLPIVPSDDLDAALNQEIFRATKQQPCSGCGR